MPFTVSHAAAVLPMRMRGLSTSALVIGAMAPDLPLFAPFLGYTTEQTHTVFATTVTNTLVGLCLFVLWHGFLARPADWFAPSGIRARLTPAQQPGLRMRLATPARVLGVLAGLYLGGLTHQFLDWFTHSGTVVTDRVALFHAQVGGLPVYYLLQILLSVVGLAVLGWWGIRWYRQAPTYPLHRQPSTLGKLAARAAVVGGAVTAVIATGILVVGSGTATVFAMSVAPVAAAGVVSAVIATIWHLSPKDYRRMAVR